MKKAITNQYIRLLTIVASIEVRHEENNQLILAYGITVIYRTNLLCTVPAELVLPYPLS